MLAFEDVHLAQGSFTLSADWNVERGARVALIGGSGAGKSTLLSAVAGFLPVAKGKLRWETRVLNDLEPAARPVTMLFQDHNLFGHLTVTQNVALGVSPSLKLNAAQETRIAQVLERVGLDGYGARRPAGLSGGQQSRVALARAMLRDRALWLLDEPFAALGPGLRQEMLALVSQMADAAGATVLMVTHDPDDAMRFADQTVFVADGIARAPVPTKALLADPPDALRAYLGT
ncbi:MAG: thiamine transport system ATP-binding protein [Dinoroseobacter sp.]|jgi:thiamine transport system ATP-binding protein